MNDNELMRLINRERELEGETQAVRLEIIKQLIQDEPVEVYSGELFEGAYLTLTSAKVLITHTEGAAYSFVRPDVELVISAVPLAAKAKGGRTGGGGRPLDTNPSADAIYMRERRRKKKSGDGK